MPVSARRPVGFPVWALIGLVAIAPLVAGCGGSAVSSAAVSVAPTRAVSVPTGTAQPSPIPGTIPGASPTPGVEAASPTGPAASVAPSGSLVADPGLLEALPARVQGYPVQRSAGQEAVIGGASDLTLSAVSYAAGEVADTDGQNIAVASLILLRPGVDAAAFFRDWRPSFDRSACDAMGGVSSTSMQAIGGRTVETTRCVGGAVILHVRLRGGSLLVSVFELGAKEFGRALVEGAKG